MMGMLSLLGRSCSRSGPSIQLLRSMSSRVVIEHTTQLVSTGQRLHYVVNEASSSSSSLSTLLLPGALGSFHTDFSYQLASDYPWPSALRLVGWDPPGYGDSRPPGRRFDVDFLEKDAHALVDLMVNVLKESRFALVGWSDGGITGLLAAILYPQHVERLVVLGTNSFFSAKDLEMIERTRDVNNWSQRMRLPMEQMYGQQGFRDMWNDLLDTYNDIREQRGGEVCRQRLGDIQCPTLIVHGDKDAMIDPVHPDILLNAIPNARLERFPDGKHNLHFKYNQQFNELIADFLAPNLSKWNRNPNCEGIPR